MQLTTGNTFNGKAGTATAVTYTIMGDRKTTSDSYEVLGQGQLPSSTGALLTTSPVAASTQLIVSSILLTNATASPVTGIVLYLNGTAAANQIVTISLVANGSATYKTGQWQTYDAGGAILGGSGIVASVTAADGSITVGGTATNPTLSRPALTGDVTASAGSNATTLATGNAGNLNSGTLLAGRMPALTGDVTTSAGAVATTVSKINGTTLSGLATGILKNTTGTGVPSIATASDIPTTPSGSALGTGRTVTTTAPLTIDATTSADLSANRTLAISAATTTTAGSQSGADKLKEDNMWYDIVAQGGADRTGSVDATAIIQAAVDAVATAGGGVVYIPRGTYKVSSAITITGNYVTVRGASRVAAKLVPTHATGNVFTVSGIFNRFEYLRIEPTSFTNRTAAYAIEFTSTASNCGCQWVDILGMWSAIKATGQLCRLEDMNIRECGYGAINGCIILIDSFTDQYLSKIVSDNGTVAPNAPMAGFSGIRVTQLSSLLMSDCQIIHCGIGMDVVPTGANSIPSIYCMNTFFDQGTYGARLTPGSGSIVRCRFIGVWFSGNSVAGAQLNGTSIDGLDFIGCEFYGAPSQPFGIDALAATEWSVRASRFAGNGTNAIRTTAGAAHSFSITDCIIGAVSGVAANAQGINIQAGTYKRYQILDNRGLDTNTTKGIIDLGVVSATDQKNVGNNMGGVLKGAIATLAAPLSIPITTETLVLNARIPAGGVSVGQVFRIKAIGVMSAANAVTWKVKVGAAGTAAGDTACWTPTIAPVGAANLRHSCEVYLTVRSLGAPGSVNAEGLQQSGATAVAITFQQPAAGVAATTAATTTADWFIDITLTQTVGTTLVQEAVIEAL